MITPDPYFVNGCKLTLLLLCWLFCSCGTVLSQELRRHPHPFSVYLDLRAAQPDDKPQTVPAWVEAFEFIPGQMKGSDAASPSGLQPARSTYRFRLKHPSPAADYLQARVFFDDLSEGARPVLTVWNEIGESMMPAKSLGQGLGLPSSDSLTVSMTGVNYLEIETDGDGSQMRGIFLSWLEPRRILQPTDFLSKDEVSQPFNILPAERTHRDDSYLYGVVTARLMGKKAQVLRPDGSVRSGYEFELEHRPLMAVIHFEVLGAMVNSPPMIIVNGHSQGSAEFHLPDLTDPGFQGVARENQSQMAFRYTGWLRAQKVLSCEWLSAGLNNLSVELSNLTESMAIRSVSIQLKYEWDKFDYVLVPNPDHHEDALSPTP